MNKFIRHRQPILPGFTAADLHCARLTRLLP